MLKVLTVGRCLYPPAACALHGTRSLLTYIGCMGGTPQRLGARGGEGARAIPPRRQRPTHSLWLMACPRPCGGVQLRLAPPMVLIGGIKGGPEEGWFPSSPGCQGFTNTPGRQKAARSVRSLVPALGPCLSRHTRAYPGRHTTLSRARADEQVQGASPLTKRGGTRLEARAGGAGQPATVGWAEDKHSGQMWL